MPINSIQVERNRSKWHKCYLIFIFKVMAKFLKCFWGSSAVQPGSGKLKMVLKVEMEDSKKRSKVMQNITGWLGVNSVALEGNENNKIAVVGEGIDPVSLILKLRCEMGDVQLISVAAVQEKKN
ncbi:putative heavy metal-associated isoprenylated plant protein/47 [Dioscorea sansibarensis]